MSTRDNSTWRPGIAMPRPDGAEAPRPDLLDNPLATRVTRVAGLARRNARTKHSRFLVEGPQGVREVVTHEPGLVHDLYLTQDAVSRHAELRSAAVNAGIYTHVVTDAVMAAMSPDAQGLLAVVSTDAGAGRSTGEDRLNEVLAGGARLVAVLTETQDPGNAGTIIRAADAAGADAVVLVRGSVDTTNPKVVRSTAGSLFHLPVITGLVLDDVVDAVRQAGLRVLAADGEGSEPLFSAGTEARLVAPTAWLLGNEAHGLSPEALAHADAVVSIPVYGAAESLNVATAAAVCLYASARAQHSQD